MAKRKRGTKRKSLAEEGYLPYLGSMRVRENARDGQLHLQPGLSELDLAGKQLGIVTHHADGSGCTAKTVVVAQDSELKDASLVYTCRGCLRRVKSTEMTITNLEPLIFHLFGDESTAEDIVVFGIVLFHVNDVEAAEKAFAGILKESGVPDGTRFHCREIFSGDARKKSPWSHLSEFDVFQLVGELIECLKKHRSAFYVGVVDRATYPEYLPSEFGRNIKVLPEHLYALAFAAAMGAVSCQGFTNIRLWIDRQKSKVDYWGMGKMQVRRLLRWNNLDPEPLQEPKPILLDAADLVAYVSGRALSRRPARYKWFFDNSYASLSPSVADGWWNPVISPNTVSGPQGVPVMDGRARQLPRK
jgi:hypothetical protein